MGVGGSREVRMDAEAMGSVAAGAAGKVVLKIVSCFRVQTQSIALRSVLIYSHMATAWASM